MSWKFLISFAIGVGFYLVVMLVIAFIKRYKKKHPKNVDSNNVDDTARKE